MSYPVCVCLQMTIDWQGQGAAADSGTADSQWDPHQQSSTVLVDSKLVPRF